MSEYFKRMKYFDYFLEHLIEGSACTEGPRGLKYYDMLYRAVCLGETQGLDADPGPYYPFVLVAHYFWRRGDICKACVFLEKARGRRPLHYDKDEKTAAALLEAAIREGVEGVRRVKTEDTHCSWASLFRDILIAELDPATRAEALRRIRQALKLVEEETADLTEEIIEGYNIILPPRAPYIYIHYAVEELEKQKAPRRNVGNVVRNIISRIAVR
ncbi:MAG: hypothetical protein ACO2PM_18305 [Pyrobaculum sp.]|jgi:hypothetical protein